MTLLREPLSIENALFKTFGELTLERCAELTGRKPHYLRAIADPAKRERLTVIDLIKLDSATIRAGRGAPLFETAGLILKAVQAEIFSDELAIGDVAAEVLKEHADVHLAFFRAVRPGSTTRDLQELLRQAEEANRADQLAITTVRNILERRAQAPP